MIAELSLYQKT